MELLSYSQSKSIFNLRFPVILCKGAHRAWLPNVLRKILSDEVVTLINPESLYSACTTIDSIYDFCNHLISLEPKANPQPTLFCLGSIPDLVLRDMVSLMGNFYGKTPLLNEIHDSSKCVFIDSSLAREYGYRPPNTSQAIEYWLRQEISSD